MRNLADELRRYLHGWRGNLPAAWREKLVGVGPDYTAVPANASLAWGARIGPDRREGGGAFYALDGIDPADVAVVAVGNEPHPDPIRATGRSFEQGDLTDWHCDLAEPGRVTASLLSLVCAAAALLPSAAGLGLDGGLLRGRREKLRCGLRDGKVVLPPPRTLFESLTGQGVLWLNCTPTMSVRRRGSSWQAIEEHRALHRALWRPVTDAIVSALTEEARYKPVVFALFGGEVGNLRGRVKARGDCRDVPEENLRLVESGHPSAPRHFFRSGNPLDRINCELTACGREPIDWCGPTAERTVGNDSPAPQPAFDGTGGSVPAVDHSAPAASVRSTAIMVRTVGKYRTTLRQLAER